MTLFEMEQTQQYARLTRPTASSQSSAERALERRVPFSEPGGDSTETLGGRHVINETDRPAPATVEVVHEPSLPPSLRIAKV